MSLRGIFPIDKWDFDTESILINLPATELELLMVRHTELDYRKGEIIFKEGGWPSGIYFIKSGKVKKFKTGSDKKEQIIYVANSGELIGYHAILADDRYSDSAAAIEETCLIFIPAADFTTALNQCPELTKRLLKTLSHEFAVLANSITLYARRSVRERLALQLILLREKYKDNLEAGGKIEINMGRDDLASLAGTARENVVRILSELKAEGILESKGRKIVINDVRKLIDIANG